MRKDLPKIEPCPYCSSEHTSIRLVFPVRVDRSSGFFIVFCLSCHAQGPEAHSDYDAVLHWNRVAERAAMPEVVRDDG